MKKSLLTIAAAAMTLSAAAATPTYSWHYLLDGPQGDMFSQVMATADGDLSKGADRKSLVLGGGAPTGYSCAYNATSKTLYSLTRGNNVFTFAGSEEKSAKPAGWGAILTAHKVTDAGVDNVTANSTDVTFGTADGVITVNATAATLVTIVNAAGQTVCSDTVSGSANIAVTPGLYLANNVKLLVK